MGGKTAANNRCFCDEGCLDMDDCCEDYSVECQGRSEEHTSELQSLTNLVCRLLLEKKKNEKKRK